MFPDTLLTARNSYMDGSLARQYFPVDNHTMLTNPLHCLRRDNLTAKQFELILHKNC